MAVYLQMDSRMFGTVTKESSPSSSPLDGKPEWQWKPLHQDSLVSWLHQAIAGATCLQREWGRGNSSSSKPSSTADRLIWNQGQALAVNQSIEGDSNSPFSSSRMLAICQPLRSFNPRPNSGQISEWLAIPRLAQQSIKPLPLVKADAHYFYHKPMS